MMMAPGDPAFFVGMKGLTAVFVRTSGGEIAEVVYVSAGGDEYIVSVWLAVADRFLRRFAPAGQVAAWEAEMEEQDDMTRRGLGACSLPSWELGEGWRTHVIA